MRCRLLAAALALSAAAPAPPDPVIGDWLTQDHDGVIRIQPCDRGLCGTIVGVVGFKPDGSPPRDIAGQSRCRMVIITDAARSSSGTWTGHIRNPDTGRVHDIELSTDAQSRLQLRGFVVIPLLGSSVVWTRFKGRLTSDCHFA